jgi:hypothetical protein
MPSLDPEIQARYLDRLDDLTWDDEDPRLDCGAAGLPHFAAAFERETNWERRARLVRVIWQFRDPAVLPILAIALRDPSSGVWKDALDGIVTLGGQDALCILKKAQIAAAAETSESEKLAWIDEAAGQVADAIEQAAI